MNNKIIATMQYNGKGFDLIYEGKSIYTVKDGDTLNYYVPCDNHVSKSVIKFIVMIGVLVIIMEQLLMVHRLFGQLIIKGRKKCIIVSLVDCRKLLTMS